MKRSDVKKGMRVVLKEDTEAFYSGFACNPEVIIRAGEIGTISSEPDRFQTGTNGYRSQVCVDFETSISHASNPPCYTWRIKVTLDKIRKVKP